MMKICIHCGKMLHKRARKVTPGLKMRCRDCNEPDISSTPSGPVEAANPIESTVAKPNYIRPEPEKKREVQPVGQTVNGQEAKPKHYIKRKKRETKKHPVIDSKTLKKKNK